LSSGNQWKSTPCSIDALRPVAGFTGLPDTAGENTISTTLVDEPAVDAAQRAGGVEPRPEQRVQDRRQVRRRRHRERQRDEERDVLAVRDDPAGDAITPTTTAVSRATRTSDRGDAAPRRMTFA
jgi:hypothetical protein